MSCLAIVTSLLNAAVPVADVVGPRIYPIMAKQGAAPPLLIMNIVGGIDSDTLAGAGRYYQQRVSIEVLHTNATDCMALGDAVLTALSDVIKQTVAGFSDVDVAFAGTDFTDYADDQSAYRRTLQFTVRFRA